MRHLKKGRELGRERSQRKMLFKTILGSLIMKGKITTTEAKAKEIKGKMDKLVTKAKKSSDETKKLAVIRDLNKIIPQKAAKRLVDELVGRFSKRNSGYTRIIKMEPRKSDGAKMAIIEFVD